MLQSLTNTGEFYISLLRLNRPQLVENRLQRRLLRLLKESRDLLQEENSTLRQRIATMEIYIQFLLSKVEG